MPVGARFSLLIFLCSVFSACPLPAGQADPAVLDHIRQSHAVIYARVPGTDRYVIDRIELFPSSPPIRVKAAPPGPAPSAGESAPPALPVYPGAFPNTSPPGGVSRDLPYVPNELMLQFPAHVSAQTAEALIRDLGATLIRRIRQIRYYRILLPEGMSVPRAMARLKGSGVQVNTEPNYLIPLSYVPNDPQFSDQWALDNDSDADIDAPDAWDIERGAPGIIIAVVDTGVDITHPDLESNIWINPGEIPGNGLDDDHNGFIDDVNGWDFVGSCNNPMDDHGHGTLVAGIAAAVGDNRTGITGVAPGCGIMPVRAGYRNDAGEGELESAAAAEAIIYAAENGARIINASWGNTARSGVIEAAVAFAESKGVTLVAAAGNQSSGTPIFPAALDMDNVVAVGATNREDTRAYFSNYGDWVHVSAPGLSILGTALNHGYTREDGTSVAAPLVSGALGLLFSKDPRISPGQAKSLLMLTADPLPALENINQSAGRLNVSSLLQGYAGSPYLISLGESATYPLEVLELHGIGFGPSRGQVWFSNNHPARILSWSDSTIRCQVPAEAGSGPVFVQAATGRSNARDLTLMTRYYLESRPRGALSCTGASTGWQGDDRSWRFALPFAFPFFQNTYESLYVCSNGFLDFTDDTPSFNAAVQTLANRNMIAPLWSDLTVSDILISTLGTDAVCFRWQGRSYETGAPVEMETVLYKNGDIRFNYGMAPDIPDSIIGISRKDTGRVLATTPQDQTQSLLFQPSTLTQIPLKPGWNLISLPRAPLDPSVATLLSPILDRLILATGYEQGVWSAYDPAAPGAADLTQIIPGKGYWLNLRTAASLDFHGTATPRTLTLAKGWNLVGFNRTDALAVETALASIQADLISAWADSDGQWQIFTPRNPGAATLNHMVPGKGYWLNMEREATWILPE